MLLVTLSVPITSPSLFRQTTFTVFSPALVNLIATAMLPSVTSMILSALAVPVLLPLSSYTSTSTPSLMMILYPDTPSTAFQDNIPLLYVSSPLISPTLAVNSPENAELFAALSAVAETEMIYSLTPSTK